MSGLKSYTGTKLETLVAYESAQLRRADFDNPRVPLLLQDIAVWWDFISDPNLRTPPVSDVRGVSSAAAARPSAAGGGGSRHTKGKEPAAVPEATWTAQAMKALQSYVRKGKYLRKLREYAAGRYKAQREAILLVPSLQSVTASSSTPRRGDAVAAGMNSSGASFSGQSHVHSALTDPRHTSMDRVPHIGTSPVKHVFASFLAEQVGGGRKKKGFSLKFWRKEKATSREKDTKVMAQRLVWLLRAFLRTLPEPLIPTDCIRALPPTTTSANDFTEMMRSVVCQQHPYAYSTFYYIQKVLRRHAHDMVSADRAGIAQEMLREPLPHATGIVMDMLAPRVQVATVSPLQGGTEAETNGTPGKQVGVKFTAVEQSSLQPSTDAVPLVGVSGPRLSVNDPRKGLTASGNSAITATPRCPCSSNSTDDSVKNDTSKSRMAPQRIPPNPAVNTPQPEVLPHTAISDVSLISSDSSLVRATRGASLLASLGPIMATTARGAATIDASSSGDSSSDSELHFPRRLTFPVRASSDASAALQPLQPVRLNRLEKDGYASQLNPSKPEPVAPDAMVSGGAGKDSSSTVSSEDEMAISGSRPLQKVVPLQVVSIPTVRGGILMGDTSEEDEYTGPVSQDRDPTIADPATGAAVTAAAVFRNKSSTDSRGTSAPSDRIYKSEPSQTVPLARIIPLAAKAMMSDTSSETEDSPSGLLRRCPLGTNVDVAPTVAKAALNSLSGSDASDFPVGGAPPPQLAVVQSVQPAGRAAATPGDHNSGGDPLSPEGEGSMRGGPTLSARPAIGTMAISRCTSSSSISNHVEDSDNSASDIPCKTDTEIAMFGGLPHSTIQAIPRTVPGRQQSATMLFSGSSSSHEPLVSSKDEGSALEAPAGTCTSSAAASHEFKQAAPPVIALSRSTPLKERATCDETHRQPDGDLKGMTSTAVITSLPASLTAPVWSEAPTGSSAAQIPSSVPAVTGDHSIPSSPSSTNSARSAFVSSQEEAPREVVLTEREQPDGGNTQGRTIMRPPPSSSTCDSGDTFHSAGDALPSSHADTSPAAAQPTHFHTLSPVTVGAPAAVAAECRGRMIPKVSPDLSTEDSATPSGTKPVLSVSRAAPLVSNQVHYQESSSSNSSHSRSELYPAEGRRFLDSHSKTSSESPPSHTPAALILSSGVGPTKTDKVGTQAASHVTSVLPRGPVPDANGVGPVGAAAISLANPTELAASFDGLAMMRSWPHLQIPSPSVSPPTVEMDVDVEGRLPLESLQRQDPTSSPSVSKGASLNCLPRHPSPEAVTATTSGVRVSSTQPLNTSHPSATTPFRTSGDPHSRLAGGSTPSRFSPSPRWSALQSAKRSFLASTVDGLSPEVQTVHASRSIDAATTLATTSSSMVHTTSNNLPSPSVALLSQPYQCPPSAALLDIMMDMLTGVNPRAAAQRLRCFIEDNRPAVAAAEEWGSVAHIDVSDEKQSPAKGEHPVPSTARGPASRPESHIDAINAKRKRNRSLPSPSAVGTGSGAAPSGAKAEMADLQKSIVDLRVLLSEREKELDVHAQENDVRLHEVLMRCAALERTQREQEQTRRYAEAKLTDLSYRLERHQEDEVRLQLQLATTEAQNGRLRDALIQGK